MIRYSNEPPEVQAYCDLRVKAGMSPKSVAADSKRFTKWSVSILRFMKINN